MKMYKVKKEALWLWGTHTITYVDPKSNELHTYDFDGTDWNLLNTHKLGEIK